MPGAAKTVAGIVAGNQILRVVLENGNERQIWEILIYPNLPNLPFVRRPQMRHKHTLLLSSLVLFTITVWAQVAPPPAPWRGAGPTPCVGSDNFIFQCTPAPQVIAVRAGRLFDSKNGQMLTRQGVLLQGERITDVGPENQIKIPA